MMMQEVSVGWVPQACTLSRAEQPLRVAEFDELFATALRAVDRVAPTVLRLVLDAAADATARDLAGRETSCCSFLSFDVRPAETGTVVMEVSVPATHVEVLDALAGRAATASGVSA